jgi:hypothetical protein
VLSWLSRYFALPNELQGSFFNFCDECHRNSGNKNFLMSDKKYSYIQQTGTSGRYNVRALRL